MRDFHFPGRSPVYAGRAMAATSMPAATLAALDALRAGGNALDAAVTAAATLAVIEPQSTGIGGDCFCLYKKADSPEIIALNGSGRAPQAATIDHYESHGITEFDPTSPHTVTIPGAVSAWETVLAAHGKRDLAAALAPAIRYAEAGFPVHPRVAFDWAIAADKLRKTGADQFLPGGNPPTPGTIIRQPDLARTLRAIAAHGARAFYEGPIAAAMVAELRARGGLHTEADFAEGRTAAKFVTPIQRDFDGMTIWECPPNGSGILALMLLGILEGFGPAPDGPLGPVRLHRHIEAARLVYRDRDALLADPDQSPIPIDHLLSDDYLTSLRLLINDEQTIKDLPRAGENLLPAHRDTVYLCVVDEAGNACSFINSTYESFGSGILAGNTGIILQNRGLGFSLRRGHPNCIAPRKRPMHTIIPGMATRNGRAVMPFGVMGGHYQPMGQSWLLTNLRHYGLDIQESLDLPRAFPYAGQVELERGIPQSTIDGLIARGHTLATTDRPLGGGQAILIDHQRGILIGGSDPRKDGCALGY
ncbi:gamma-glutamyltransferase family protein [Acidiphilium iwatense]|uniref:Gamma-glutamyltransferase family protein n=1 Tax=Acidiphilium iwatense TaxID=768198 RepID=A0ABS9DSW2_9PROT|nr:gamma-glutamyltransferase family protein [Acidiphilium iwatense]MCF3945275.1 gamma-glutamyltransferase family protein [Acidiphilium iwatense]